MPCQSSHISRVWRDFVPVSNLIRVIILPQIVTEVLLMLFGFAEFISYGRIRQQRRSKD